MLRITTVSVEADSAEEMRKLVFALWDMGYRGQVNHDTFIRIYLAPKLGQNTEDVENIINGMSKDEEIEATL